MKSIKFGNTGKVKMFVLFAVLFSSCWLPLLLDGAMGRGGKALRYYSFENCSKKNLNESIKWFYKKYPTFKVDNETLENNHLIRHGLLGIKDENDYYEKINADSISFYFKSSINDTTIVIYHMMISGRQENWSLDTNISFDLVGVTENYENWILMEEVER